MYIFTILGDSLTEAEEDFDPLMIKSRHVRWTLSRACRCNWGCKLLFLSLLFLLMTTGIIIASIVSGPMMSASKNAEASDSSSIVYNTTDSPVVILTTEASSKPRTMCSFLDDHVYLLILGVYF